MPDRSALDAFLKEAGFAGSGDIVFLDSVASETREVRRSEKSVVVTISTRARDRHGDIVDPDGVRLARFRKNPVVLYAHDYDGLPVARSLWERLREGELLAKPQFHLETELSREVWALVEKGVLSAWSVGFIPEEWEPAPGGRGFRIKKWDLLEYSSVPVPANFEALTRELEERRITAPALVKSLAPFGLRPPDLVAQPVRIGYGDGRERADRRSQTSEQAGRGQTAAEQQRPLQTGASPAPAPQPAASESPVAAAQIAPSPVASAPIEESPGQEAGRSPHGPKSGQPAGPEGAPPARAPRTLPRLTAEELSGAVGRAFERVIRRARGDMAFGR